MHIHTYLPSHPLVLSQYIHHSTTAVLLSRRPCRPLPFWLRATLPRLSFPTSASPASAPTAPTTLRPNRMHSLVPTLLPVRLVARHRSAHFVGQRAVPYLVTPPTASEVLLGALETRTRGIAPNSWNSTRAIPRLSYSTLLFHGLLFHGTVFVFH